MVRTGAGFLVAVGGLKPYFVSLGIQGDDQFSAGTNVDTFGPFEVEQDVAHLGPSVNNEVILQLPLPGTVVLNVDALVDIGVLDSSKLGDARLPVAPNRCRLSNCSGRPAGRWS